MPTDDNRVSVADIGYIAKLLNQHVTSELAAVAQWRDALQTTVNDVVIKRVEPVLNDMLETAPQETLKEKQELCRQINAALAEMDLAVRCPGTDEPATLRAGGAGGGEFQFEVIGRGAGRRRMVHSRTLGDLELCVAPMAVAGVRARGR